MRARLVSRILAWCLVMCLGSLLALTSTVGALSVRDWHYDGVWQDFGGGWQYLYYSSQDQAYWRQIGSSSRLSYQYTPGQWLDCDKFGTWRNIGASGVTDSWIGDGVWHNLKNGWSYAYSASLNAGYWSDASGQRLAYFYTPGQWWDIGKIGGWSTLSGADMTGAFIGDGVWYNLKNGWSYAYLASNDTGYWGTGLGQRFAYNYTPGQWWDIARTGTWSSLGGTGLTSVFVADGAWHDIKNGWTYAYLSNLDCGYWGIGSGQRFAYDYWNTQWWHIGAYGGWSVLSGIQVSPDFVGDGNWHGWPLANGTWSYAYLKSVDTGYWGDIGANQRFAYQYAPGQWWDKGDSTPWCTLGRTNQSSAFIGDGAWHTLATAGVGPYPPTWNYQYVNDVGHLQGPSTIWWPGQSGGGTWAAAAFDCVYAYQVFGFYIDGNSGKSVYRYDYNGGSSYNSKWEDWNFTDNGTETSAAIVFYNGTSTHDVSSWLSWLPVSPNPGFIGRTETWDFTNNDWANRYNHEVRAFATMWLVQREQGSIGNCGIIASIDAFEAKYGLYIGYTKYWMDTAIAHGWSDSGGGTSNSGRDSLLEYMGTYYGLPISAYYGSSSNRSLSDLLGFVNQGQKVILAVDLHYIPEFGSWSPSENANHAIMLVGDAYIGGVHYAAITNGWDIQSGTTQISGYDPKSAYPITYIPWSELVAAYYAYNRVE